MYKGSTAVAIAMAAGLAACGSKDKSTSSVASALDFCTNGYSAIMDGVAKCETWSAAAADMMKTRQADTCKAIQKDVTEKRASYDSGKAAACLDALKAITDCAQLHDIEDGSSDMVEKLLPACKSVLMPAVKLGGSCYDGSHCADGWCDESNNACPGTCKAPAAEGQDCTQVPCADGLRCWYGTSSATCQKPSAAGQSCLSNSCEDGLDCDGSTSPPTCVAERDVGQSCGSVGCKTGLYCDAATSQCAARKTSGACTANKECEVGYRCASSGAQGGTCKKMLGLDEACAIAEYTCGLGYYCDPSTLKCAKTPAIGEACDSSDRYCLAGYCDPGTSKCVACKALGDDCDPMSSAYGQCGYDAYCDYTTKKCKANDACSAP